MTHYEALALMLLFGAVAILVVLQIIEHGERKAMRALINGLRDENKRLRARLQIAEHANDVTGRTQGL